MENNISLKQFTQKVEALVKLLQEKDAKIALLEAEKEELRKEIKISYAENVELQNKYDNLPESLQESSRGEDIQEAIERLEDVLSYLEDHEYSDAADLLSEF